MDMAMDVLRPAVGHSFGALFLPYLERAEAELLAIAYFDRRGTVIDLDVSRGARASVRFPLRHIVQSAIAQDAAAIMLAHNHPSGDPRPSRADREMTRLLSSALRPLDIRLLDHLIFAGGQVSGFRALGLL